MSEFIRANNQTEVPVVLEMWYKEWRKYNSVEEIRGLEEAWGFKILRLAEIMADYAYNSKSVMIDYYGERAVDIGITNLRYILNINKSDLVRLFKVKTNLVKQPKQKTVDITEENAVKLLKSLGYKLMKPVTEFKEV